jgi:agmatine deiminase
MKKINIIMSCISILIIVLAMAGCSKEPVNPNDSIDADPAKNYTMPEETAEHEGTWLQWPHNYTYGPGYRGDVEHTWIEMTRGLIKGENVHIIAYNKQEKTHIINVLTKAGVSLNRVDFYLYQTDDFWVRDNGPVFVYDEDNNLVITDWGFNGWGEKMPYAKCDIIPNKISSDVGIARLDLSSVVLEGGAIEIDGNGTFMATRSSVTNPNRNPNLTEEQIENNLKKYLGVSNFIWLDGVYNSDDITDYHIDGFAKFHDSTTIVCLNQNDLQTWGVTQKDIDTLFNAKDKDGKSYEYVYLPLTQNNVVTEWGESIGYDGSYVNYYIGNKVVLVPNYNDPNDEIANEILQNLYPEREVIGIDVCNLYYGGGMIHCITQQQPASK